MKASVIQLKMFNRLTTYSDNIKRGDIFLELKKYSLAIEAFEEAADYATNKEDAVIALIKLGISERLKGRYYDAMQSFKLAIKKTYFISDNYSYNVAMIKREIGILLVMESDHNHNYETLDEATKYFGESFLVLLQTSHNVQAAISQELLGISLFLKGESFQKDAIGMIKTAGKTISRSNCSSYVEELDNLIWLAMVSIKYRCMYLFRIMRLATYTYPDNYAKVLKIIFRVISGNWINKKLREI